jgi:hypothetical protein
MNINRFFISMGLLVALGSISEVRGASAASSSTPHHIQISGTEGSILQIIPGGSPSTDLWVSVRDILDQETVVPSGKTVYLTARDSAGISFSPEISVDEGPFETSPVTLVIGTGQGKSNRFRFKRTLTGRVSLQAEIVDFPSSGQSRFAWYTIEVLPYGATFTNLRARTTSQPSSTLGATATFSPDRDGLNDGAVLVCTPPSTTTNWELLISSESSFAASGIVRRFSGTGPTETYWYGESFEGRTVKNGTYYARYQTMGAGIVSSHLTLTVQAAGIEGRVKDESSTVLPDVEVNVYGSGGGGYGKTASDGRFFVNGLKPQSSYQIELRKLGMITQSFSATTGLATDSPLDVGTKILSSGVTLEISATAISAPTRDIYGDIRVYNDNHTENYWGPIRIASGAITSDNGRHANDPMAGSDSLITVRPSVSYTVEITLPDFGRSTQTVNTPTTGSQPILFTGLTRKANIYGTVQLPSDMQSPFNGEWVSVDALLPGSSMPTVSGGVYIPNGSRSGTYQLPGVPSGDYILRAQVRGFIPSSRTVTVTDVDQDGIDFPTFLTGGTLSGTVTVTGDSSSFGSGGLTGTNCSTGFFPVTLTASSRGTYGHSFTQICLSQSSTSSTGSFQFQGLLDGVYEIYSHLPGFQLVPAGSQTGAVSDGVGTRNITFQALTGQVKIQATLPNDDSGQNVTYQLLKDPPNAVTRSGVLAGSPNATKTESQLGTGLYRIIVQNNNPGRGLVQETVVAVTNGALSTATVDLTLPAYSISGNVEMVGNVVLPSPWNVTVSSVAGLVAAGITPTVDVYALPLPHYYQHDFLPIRSVPVTVFTSSATYTVSGLSPGAYQVRLREDVNATSDYPSVNLPEMASDAQVVYVSTGALTGVHLTLTNGAKVSGTLSRPDNSTDSLSFSFQLRRSNNLSLWGLSNESSGSGVTYSFSHVAPGDYVLEITQQGTTARYATPPISIKVGSGDATANATLSNGGVLVGQLRDADTQTLLTDKNVAQYLPSNFEIAAQANPSISGGYVQAHRNNDSGRVSIDPITGQFKISRLIPETQYDLRLRGDTALGNDALALGVKTYAPIQISGIKVTAGQTVDVGVVDLRQGNVLSGTVRNAEGTPLPNIRVRARPSANNGGDQWAYQVETFTQENGRYELQGIDRAKGFYDVIASPRFRSGESYARLSGPRYAEERRRAININDSTKLTGNDFSLSLANGVITGRVVSADNGTLTPALSDENNQGGERGADIVLHRTGAPFDDNPLGEIEERTNADGTFRVEGLKPGAYTLRAMALGYTSVQAPIVVPAGTASAGTITLARGATVSGTITKPDGSAPTIDEVRQVLGVDTNFDEFIFGRIESNQDTKQVTGYSISGFQTEKNYSLIILPGNDSIIEAQTGVLFADATEERVIPLLYRAAAPRVFVNQSQTVVGENRVTSLRLFSTQPLRNLTLADNDPSTLLTIEQGAGTLSNVEINSSRESVIAVYTVPVLQNESSFKIRASFYTTEKDSDSSTGENFRFNQLFTFHAGIKNRRSTSISNVTGGECTLEGAPAGVVFRAGSFDVATSSSVAIGIQSADALIPPTIAVPRLARNAAISQTVRTLGAAAYPSTDLFQAVSDGPDVDPFSAFYDIFLPTGLSHLLKKDARLTLEYDADVADPSQLNVYFYDPIHSVYLLENAQKTVDEVNHTITVSVGHMSTFVVLPSQASIIGSNTYTGPTIQVHNVPNPFNLKSKTLTLNAAEAADRVQTIEGTMIRYSLPVGKNGDVKIEIYDVAGALVRVLSQSAPIDGTYYYLEWDGRNDRGQNTASGVYLARFTLNGGDEKIFKMAVIK